jgi:hypothetical protein
MLREAFPEYAAYTGRARLIRAMASAQSRLQHSLQRRIELFGTEISPALPPAAGADRRRHPPMRGQPLQVLQSAVLDS